MGQLAYNFTLTLLHSLWQSALLLLVYYVIILIIQKQYPHARRNALYFLLVVQLVLSGITFWFYFAGFENLYEPLIALEYAAIFTSHSLFEKLAPWILYIYMAVVSYKSITLFYSWNKFTRCGKSWIRPAVELKVFMMIKAREFGIERKINLWFSNTISTPVTFGFFKPVILLPVALINQLTTEEAETLILHELTHIKSNDYLLNFLLILSDTVFFFNPFIKIIAGKIKMEREKNCDLQVLHFKYSSLTYAETLLKAARFKLQSRPFLMAAVSRKRQLLNRILFFTAHNSSDMSKRNNNALTYLLVLIVFCLNLFALAEIKSERTKSGNVYTPSIIPGFNADRIYAYLSDRALSSTMPHVERTLKAIDNPRSTFNSNLHQLIPSEKELEELTEKALEEAEIDENYIIPVSATEAQDIKEVIVNEENSVSGNSTTKAYKMIFINGQWMAEPIWMYTESKLKKDSTQLLKDSIVKPFHIIQ